MDGKITGAEKLPFGKDECIKFMVQPIANDLARGLAVDDENHCWVGYWNANKVVRLAPEDGAVVTEVSLGGPGGGWSSGTYGLVIDQYGNVWGNHANATLVKIDPKTDPPTVKDYTPSLGGGFLYGIAVDVDARVWVANNSSGGFVVFDQDTEEFTTVTPSQYVGSTRGVACSLDGHCFGAHNGGNPDKLSKLDVNTFELVATYDVPGSWSTPVGVALDFDGFLWSVNQSTSTATKYNIETTDLLCTVPVGSGPYTYSDMTGFSLHTFVLIAHYFHVLEAVDEGPALWKLFEADVSGPEHTSVRVRFKAADNKEDFEAMSWSETFGPFPPYEFPLDLTPADLQGHYLMLDLTLLSGKSSQSPLVHAFTVQYVQ